MYQQTPMPEGKKKQRQFGTTPCSLVSVPFLCSRFLLSLCSKGPSPVGFWEFQRQTVLPLYCFLRLVRSPRQCFLHLDSCCVWFLSCQQGALLAVRRRRRHYRVANRINPVDMVCLAFCNKPWKIACFLSRSGGFLPLIKRLWDYSAREIRRHSWTK